MTSISHDRSNGVPVLVFSEIVLMQLVTISEQARPREGVAALYGRIEADLLTVSSARRLPNKARSRSQFLIEKNGLDGAIALFHSHPIARSFSAQDREQLARSAIPWVVGFPRCRHRFSNPLLQYRKWMFQVACGDEKKGVQSCNLLIKEEEM